jgi:ribosome biogenesis GTPase / thiamine phosphate phosphatase
MTDAAPEPLTLRALGWNGRWATLAANGADGTRPVRVMRHDGTAVLVGGEDGVESLPLRRSLPPLAVGDWLLVGDGVIVELLERASLLQRRDPTGGGAQLIAANLDLVGIVCGLDRRVRAGRIRRMVIQVWDAGAIPIVVLTKTDLLADSADAEQIAAAAAPGVDVIVISSETGEGIDVVRAAVAGRSVAFVGESGAGKSTLVNALAGDDIAATGAVRGHDNKGRHTTTARELHVLSGDVQLIDTPGMREMGLWTDVDTVDDVFDDIGELAEQCRFRDCQHASEPGCAVRVALRTGRLSADRFESWEVLRREAAAAERRADPRARHQAERRFGKVAREAQRLKRPDG